MQRLLRLRGLVDRIEEGFMAVALVFMTGLTFVQVCLRYLFDGGLVWSLEATTYTFAWMSLVGMSYGVRTRSHIAVDLLTRRLPPAGQRVAAAASLALCVGYCALLGYGSVAFVDRLAALGNDARDIPLPRWLLTSIMPVAFALLGLRFVEAAWPVVAGRAPATTGHASP